MGNLIQKAEQALANALKHDIREGIMLSFPTYTPESKMERMQQRTEARQPERGITLLQMVAIEGWDDVLEIMLDGLTPEQRLDMISRKELEHPMEIGRFSALELAALVGNGNALMVMFRGLTSDQMNQIQAENLAHFEQAGYITFATDMATPVFQIEENSSIPVVSAYPIGNVVVTDTLASPHQESTTVSNASVSSTPIVAVSPQGREQGS